MELAPTCASLEAYRNPSVFVSVLLTSQEEGLQEEGF